jgi:hypothetical protein
VGQVQPSCLKVPVITDLIQFLQQSPQLAAAEVLLSQFRQPKSVDLVVVAVVQQTTFLEQLELLIKVLQVEMDSKANLVVVEVELVKLAQTVLTPMVEMGEMVSLPR